MFKIPKENRIKSGLLASDASFGKNGAFSFQLSNRTTLYCIASSEGDWEHVSVYAKSDGKDRVTTWPEMYKVKNKFWDEEYAVVQFHHPKSSYVNSHPFSLHLWRPIKVDIILPCIEFV